ncbi:MAG: ComEC/Rec2 family competence protein [Verrucomicrobiota bacterium]|nr:ComEC/Rec2 family competence protein [Verrucomicrobiota bacterium]
MKLTGTWPRQPFIGLALAAGSGILLADWAPHRAAGLAAVLSLTALAVFRRNTLVTYLFVAASFFTLHSLRVVDSPGATLAADLGDKPRAVTVHGFVVSEPKLSGRGTNSFLLRTIAIERDGVEKPCSATLTARWAGDVQYGDEVRLFGVTGAVEGPRNPGEFDMRRHLARRDVRTSFISRYRENGRVLSHGGGNPIIAAAQASRRQLDAALSRGLEDSPNQHSLVSGIILGLRDQTPDEVEEEFQQTGTIHLFAVAGLHVGMVAYLLWTIAGALRLPRKLAICLIVPGLFFYAAITGLNTASLRAATMAAIILGGVFLDRPARAANSLAAAAFILLCFDTQQLFSMGFQLSFAVVGTIILLADPVFKWLAEWFQPDAFLPRSLLTRAQRFGQASWRRIAHGISISLSAWVGSLPLILPYFYLITPVSIFANLAVVPLAFLVLATGMMSLLATPFATSLAVIFNNANWSIASLILATVAFFARAPAGHFYIGEPHWRPGVRAEITALDLGAGAAIHLRNHGRDWLIDCGAERDFRRVVRGYLRSRGINRLDGLVLTHGDSAHIGGAVSVMRALRPSTVVDTSARDRSSMHRQLIAFCEQHLLTRRLCSAASDLSLGANVTARVLFPPADFHGATADDQALVIQLIIDDRWRVLLMSDSGEATEKWLIASGTDLHSDILIKGQHHSAPSGTVEFIERVQPEAIVTSSTNFAENERVKDDWAAMIASHGIRLLRQDETGAVTLRFFRERWEAKAFLQPEIFRNAKR